MSLPFRTRPLQLQWLKNYIAPMFDGNYKLIIKFSMVFVILAQGSSFPVSEDATSSTQKAAVSVQEVPSPVAVHESIIKKDNPAELEGDTEALVEAPVEVIGPRVVESEAQSKVQKKRESKDSFDEAEETDRRHDSSSNDDDDTKEDSAADPEGEQKSDADVSPNHSRKDDEEDIDYDDVEDDDEDNNEERGHDGNKIGVDEEEGEEEAESYAHEANLHADEDHLQNPKREGRPSRQGPKIWDQWGKWSSCSVTCGVGKLTRWRHCVAGGCSPGEKEAQLKTSCKRSGDMSKIWDQWGRWSCCTATCGMGKLTRWRHCIAGGCVSGEKEAQLKSCHVKNCKHDATNDSD